MFKLGCGIINSKSWTNSSHCPLRSDWKNLHYFETKIFRRSSKGGASSFSTPANQDKWSMSDLNGLKTRKENIIRVKNLWILL